MDLSATLVATHNFDLAREKIKKAVQLFSTIHESQAVQNAQSSMLDIDRRATQCAWLRSHPGDTWGHSCDAPASQV